MYRSGFTWHYSTQGLPDSCITAKTRELLPHVFTLIPINRDGNFLWPCLFPDKPGSRLLTGVLLCAVRTFLPPINQGTITRLIADKGRFYLFEKR